MAYHTPSNQRSFSGVFSVDSFDMHGEYRLCASVTSQVLILIEKQVNFDTFSLDHGAPQHCRRLKGVDCTWEHHKAPTKSHSSHAYLNTYTYVILCITH